jgi:hypothetical protein
MIEIIAEEVDAMHAIIPNEIAHFNMYEPAIQCGELGEFDTDLINGDDVNPNLTGILARWEWARDCDEAKRGVEFRTTGPTWKSEVESAVDEWEL